MAKGPNIEFYEMEWGHLTDGSFCSASCLTPKALQDLVKLFQKEKKTFNVMAVTLEDEYITISNDLLVLHFPKG